MKPAMTYRETRVIQTTREALEKCDYARAKRTDPTPMQREAARANWRAEPLLVRIAHLFRREQRLSRE